MNNREPMREATTGTRSVPSLDRSTKKPTVDIAAINATLAEIAAEERAERAAANAAPCWDGQLSEAPAGRWVRLSCENWRAITRDADSGALYTPLNPDRAPRRAVLITQINSRPRPPINRGDRWTDRLTPAAAQKIENAAGYCHRMGRGFRTFATLTLTPEAREQLRAWDFADPDDPTRRTLGGMVADFLKALKMAWARGQRLRAPVVGEYGPQLPVPVGRLRPHAGPLVFAWVAECPTNADGSPNPHVHLMMNWAVQKKHFRAWAAWIERLWPGFVNLTRLKKTSGAAAYMAKAARYIAKGAEGGQGRIRGNRYGIASEARAPGARPLGTFYADFLADAVRLMKSAGDKLKAAGLWAGAYAFGAATRAAWGRIWSALKRDGYQFDPAPPDLHALKFHNWQIWRRQRDADERAEWIAEQRAFCDANWNHLLHHQPNEEMTAWAH